ncbi:hypothetical protein, partial [Sphingorhabdus sp.]|uniref:hypothetical protein n=1 Tax=Sphingorhabdus sp. TaxID=1902408 RepID=UPI0032B7846B
NHSHKFVILVFGKNIALHSVLDSVIIAAGFSLTLFAIWQIVEINLIARGTAAFANKRRNAMVRRRNAFARSNEL